MARASSRRVGAVLLLAAAAAVMVSCGSKGGQAPGGAASAAGGLPRNQTLYMAGLQWGPPSTFNPISPAPTWPVSGTDRELVYETLFAYDMVSGELLPLLGKEYHWTDNLTLQVALQETAHWQNGQPFTADDVVYTFELAKRYDLPYSWFWDYVAEATAPDAHTVRLGLKPDRPNRLMTLDAICRTPMLPKAVWSAKEKELGNDGAALRAWDDMQPVGSGPYRIKDVNPQRIVLERDEGYWGKAIFGTPAPRYIAHVIYQGNESGNLALEAGDVDVSQEFVPQVWKMWEAGKPIGTWLKQAPYFYVGGSMPALFFNLHRPPMDDVAFRKAVAYAVDYTKVAELAMTRYSPTMAPGLISKFGREADLFSEKQTEELGWGYDPQKAESILQKAGYRKGTDGFYRMPDGSSMPQLKLECPHGWTDWMSTLNIVQQNLRAVGIDVSTEFPDAPVWTDRVQRGDFDIAMQSPAGAYSPAQPWLKFRNAMSARGVPAIGEGNAFWNYGRYENPEAEKLLDSIAATADDTERKSLYQELNALFMRDVPLVPVEYRPWEFYEFNTTHWTNFPTSDNPYAPPQVCIDGAGVRALYKIRPVSTAP
jgi:peptide/nickel transport system substrate-binding protein